MSDQDPAKVTRVRYAPQGASREAFIRRDPELLVSGPAGTGKSRGLLEKIHLQASKYPGMRGLMCRKTRQSLTQTAMVTFGERVLHPMDGVRFHGGDQEYRYPNESAIVVGGLDNTSKTMSSDYDVILVLEATEAAESDIEALSTRLRNGKMPYQQLLMDCNPSSPKHWLKRRADTGKTVMLESRHEDNPTLWDAKRGAWTPQGVAYIAKLDALTGVRYLRLRKGIWASSEGMVFDEWDPAVHIVPRFDIPRDWPRYWAIDFGYNNPFVWNAYAENPDGDLFRYRQIYHTGRLVEDHARQILEVSGWSYQDGYHIPTRPDFDPLPSAVICDHDREDRATFERHTGLRTVPAYKSVQSGIQAMAARIRRDERGRPRFFVLRDSLVERDSALDDAKKPASGEEEVEGYIWDPRRPDEPLKQDDHSMDADRYAIGYVDSLATGAFDMDGHMEWAERVEISPV